MHGEMKDSFECYAALKGLSQASRATNLMPQASLGESPVHINFHLPPTLPPSLLQYVYNSPIITPVRPCMKAPLISM